MTIVICFLKRPSLTVILATFCCWLWFSGEAGAFLYDLTVTVAPTFSGSVRDLGGDFDCPGDCYQDYTIPTDVTLRAYPAPGYRFDYWSGNLTGSANPRTLLVSGYYMVTANFKLNSPPSLDMIGDKSVAEATVLDFLVYAFDADGDALSFSVTNLPSGATFSGNRFLWTPSFNQAGVYEVTFAVGDGDAWVEETIFITVQNSNRRPRIVPTPDKTIRENQPLEFSISATDDDGDPLVYSAEGLPPGASFDAAATPPVFQWIPTVAQAGIYEVIFYVSDGYATASDPVRVTVLNTNQPPHLDPLDNRTIVPEEALTFVIHAHDPEGDPLTYGAEGLPPGASFDGSSQLFAWTPALSQAGGYAVTFWVSDGEFTDRQTMEIAVQIPYPELPNPFPHDMVYPGDGEVGVVADGLCLSWPAARYATTYDLLVAGDVQFTDPAFDLRELTAPSFCFDEQSGERFATSVLPYHCYFWNVVARNRYGEAHYPLYAFFTAADGDMIKSVLARPLNPVSYIIISLPVHPHNPDPAAVFGDELGPYDPSRWRLFWYSGEQERYHEYPQVPAMAPGIAYWLIAAKPVPLSAVGSPVTIEQDFIIRIPPGFSQIGCPFPFPVFWRQVKAGHAGTVVPVTDPGNDWISPWLWKFEQGAYTLSDVLEPWEGYWVQNLSSEPLELIIPPRMAAENVP